MTVGTERRATEHERALAILTERLAGDFAEHAERIQALVAAAYAETRDARVQTFRVLLAERAVRAELRRVPAHGDVRSLRATA